MELMLETTLHLSSTSIISHLLFLQGHLFYSILFRERRPTEISSVQVYVLSTFVSSSDNIHVFDPSSFENRGSETHFTDPVP